MKSFRALGIPLCAAVLAFYPAASFATVAEANVAPQPATNAILALPRTAAILQMLVVTQNLCLGYSYDQNGNRITQITNDMTSSTPTWGTSAFPCFIWQ